MHFFDVGALPRAELVPDATAASSLEGMHKERADGGGSKKGAGVVVLALFDELPQSNDSVSLHSTSRHREDECGLPVIERQSRIG